MNGQEWLSAPFKHYQYDSRRFWLLDLAAAALPLNLQTEIKQKSLEKSSQGFTVVEKNMKWQKNQSSARRAISRIC